MLYREIIAVCSQIRTKHINTLCGQNVELLNVKLAVHIVTTGDTYEYPTRCTVYLQFIELSHLYMFRAHQQPIIMR
jgi:hypothetical protein